MAGIWHKTTLQAARENQTAYQTTSIVGQKRPLEAVVKDTDRHQVAKRAPLFQSASSIPNGPPRLVASEIHTLQQYAQDGPSEYTQRKEFSSTPTAAHDALLRLSHPVYRLPKELVANFESLGIKNIYPWQKQCLLGPGLLKGEKNLVYSAPTGGGKSLVADVLMLKRVLESRDAKALLVLPYVALVQEKVRWLRSVVHGMSREAINGPVKENERRLWRKRSDEDTVRVVAFFGGSKIKPTWADFDIGVCTMEKVRPTLEIGLIIHTEACAGQLSCQHRYR